MGAHVRGLTLSLEHRCLTHVWRKAWELAAHLGTALPKPHVLLPPAPLPGLCAELWAGLCPCCPPRYDQSCCWGLGAWWGWASEEPFHPRAAEIGPVGGEGKQEHVAGQSSQSPSVASGASPSLLRLAASSAGRLGFPGGLGGPGGAAVGAESVVPLISPGVWSCCSILGNTNNITSSTVPGKRVWTLSNHHLLLGGGHCLVGPLSQTGTCHMCHWCLLVLPFEGTVRESGLGQGASAPLSLPHLFAGKPSLLLPSPLMASIWSLER